HAVRYIDDAAVICVDEKRIGPIADPFLAGARRGQTDKVVIDKIRLGDKEGRQICTNGPTPVAIAARIHEPGCAHRNEAPATEAEIASEIARITEVAPGKNPPAIVVETPLVVEATVGIDTAILETAV